MELMSAFQAASLLHAFFDFTAPLAEGLVAYSTQVVFF